MKERESESLKKQEVAHKRVRVIGVFTLLQILFSSQLSILGIFAFYGRWPERHIVCCRRWSGTRLICDQTKIKRLNYQVMTMK